MPEMSGMMFLFITAYGIDDSDAYRHRLSTAYDEFSPARADIFHVLSITTSTSTLRILSIRRPAKCSATPTGRASSEEHQHAAMPRAINGAEAHRHSTRPLPSRIYRHRASNGNARNTLHHGRNHAHLLWRRMPSSSFG